MSEAERSPVAGWLEGRPEAPAAVHADGAVTTRAELARRVSAAAAALADMPAGSRIAVDADAPHDFAVLLSAVLWRDCVPVLFAGRGAMHETLADEYDAVLTTESHRSFPKPALVADFAENPCPASELRAPEAERPLVLFTSGSSGTPKRIEKTVGLMSREAVITQRLFGRHLEGAVIAATVDPRHLYGLTFAVWMAMTTGTPVADARTVYQEQLLEFDRPVALVTTPTFMRMLDTALERPRIAFCLTAAGVLDDEALSRMHAWTGVAVHEIYGSTETGVVASRRHDAGRMNPAWTLIDEGGLEETEQGWRLASPLLPQGSILLDDRLEMSSDKVFRLLGRRDRIVKIGEIRLSLTEIERVVKEALGLEIRALSVKQAGRTVSSASARRRAGGGAVPTASRRRRRSPGGSIRSLVRASGATSPTGRQTLRARWSCRCLPNSSNTRRQHMADELKGALEVLSRTEFSIEARLVLSEGMSVFDGHFPCLAILPGVVQLNLVETLAAEWAGRPLRIASIPQMKFTVPLRPGDALLVKLAFKPAEDGLGASFSLEKEKDGEAVPASRGRIAFIFR